MAPAVPENTSILVVDDDADVRELSAMFLGELGYKVLEAGSGAEGLDMLERHPGIDLLFTDIVMPGIDGVALADRAKALRPRLHVVYATGFAEKVRALRDRPMHGPVLQKPWRGLQLASTIESELARET